MVLIFDLKRVGGWFYVVKPKRRKRERLVKIFDFKSIGRATTSEGKEKGFA